MRGHPNEAQINHTLQKVVDQLLLFWNGVFFTRTSKYARGRTVYAALAPAVCDTEGAHSISGFASHSHKYFCVRCILPIQDIHNLDSSTWPIRDIETHKLQANLWRDAPSEAARHQIYENHGMRWSELLRLPYWNPILFTVIDSMHLCYLGLFATHVRKIWKMDAEALESGEGYAQPSSDKKRKKPSNSLLRALRGATSRHVIAKDILDEVWKDMKITILPSWIDSPPENWGTKANGKLSADEWKVVCSVSLVVTLIRLWGYKYENNPQARHFQMLQNFLDLVHAVRLLNLRETSEASRNEYRSLIIKYLRTVLVLFPDVTLKPNHHYAIHIVEDLESMGPVQARNTPIFERTNHILQEINSNNHSGQSVILCVVVLRR
ncbi:hypothetical protein C8R42DRAFT_582858 [Lentinula raphanica]|nr:hypothetical protein C8R42DRAFT_582858 [Lentinula raphanica]